MERSISAIPAIAPRRIRDLSERTLQRILYGAAGSAIVTGLPGICQLYTVPNTNLKASILSLSIASGFAGLSITTGISLYGRYRRYRWIARLRYSSDPTDRLRLARAEYEDMLVDIGRARLPVDQANQKRCHAYEFLEAKIAEVNAQVDRMAAESKDLAIICPICGIKIGGLFPVPLVYNRLPVHPKCYVAFQTEQAAIQWISDHSTSFPRIA